MSWNVTNPWLSVCTNISCDWSIRDSPPFCPRSSVSSKKMSFIYGVCVSATLAFLVEVFYYVLFYALFFRSLNFSVSSSAALLLSKAVEPPDYRFLLLLKRSRDFLLDFVVVDDFLFYWWFSVVVVVFVCAAPCCFTWILIRPFSIESSLCCSTWAGGYYGLLFRFWL